MKKAVLSICFAYAAIAAHCAPVRVVSEAVVSNMIATALATATPAPRRVAMFVLEVNSSVDGPYAGFELKASTNNFASADRDARLLYYAQSENADGGESSFGHDCMKLFACVRETRGGTETDVRSYTYVTNTVVWTGKPTTLVALVDASCLVRAPPGDWLREDNDELTWCWARDTDDGTETGPDGRGLWRPVAPARWLRSVPSWAR